MEIREIKPAEARQAILEGDDFGHEMRVGGLLADLADQRKKDKDNSTVIEGVNHGGTYTDSITGKLRQFDYRCRVIQEDAPRRTWCAMLAIECKNLHKSSPLVVSGRERTRGEAYYGIIESSFEPNSGFLSVDTKGNPGKLFYQQGEFVGKSLLRLKWKEKEEKNRILEAVSDSDIYEKWSQALASSVELAASAARFAYPDRKHSSAMVLPIVVVPNDSLSKVQYSSSGCMQADPEKVDECEYFVEKRFVILGKYSFVLTHVHFVTLVGLKTLLSRFWQRPDSMESILPFGSAYQQFRLPDERP